MYRIILRLRVENLRFDAIIGQKRTNCGQVPLNLQGMLGPGATGLELKDHRRAVLWHHQTVDYGWIAKRASLLLDTRNATRQLTDPDLAKKIIRL